MPTATDLVTDLPADFEVFGQAVATSMADLLGGTSGQVLAKNSNTDMDFVWVTSDDANAIQNTIVDAKGDLISATGSDTPARLAVGNNGETLVADSSTSTGLRYQTGVNVNYAINGAQEIWQRGTSFAVAGATYTSDRWQGSRSGVAGMTISRQATNDTTNLPFIQYCSRVQRDSGNTNTTILYLGSSFESEQTRNLQGQTVVVSFYARAGANYSAGSSILESTLAYGTGTNQNIFSGLTGQSTVVSKNNTLTTTWQRFQMTGTVSATATQLALYFVFTPSGTAGANDYYEITGIQLEQGAIATTFKRAGGTIQGELAACQRYYFRYVSGLAYANLGSGMCLATNQASITVAFPVTMRTAPAAVETTGTASNYAVLSAAGAVLALTGTPTYDSNTNSQTGLIICNTSTSLVAGNATQLRANNSTTAYLGWSAEL